MLVGESQGGQQAGNQALHLWVSYHTTDLIQSLLGAALDLPGGNEGVWAEERQRYSKETELGHT